MNNNAREYLNGPYCLSFFSLTLLLFAALLSGSQAASISTQFPTGKRDIQEIDISVWVKPDSKIGNTRFAGGELFMSSKQKGYFYVLVAPEDYTSEGGTSHVEVRNVLGGATTLGYGLVFHSDPTPLVQGYAFVIDTVKGRYRVVRHEKNDEIPVIQWTKSSLIKLGKAKNILEATDKGDTTDLFINGKVVTTIKNTYAFKHGQPGLYTGDATKAAFKHLTVKN